MKLIIIICEGQTEQAFCNSVLRPHLEQKKIKIKAVLPKKTVGGIIAWSSLKEEIEIYLKQDKDARVTTLIDYYGLYSKHDYPNWETAHKIVDRSERLDCIEKGMELIIHDSLRYRFFPYIQLHEFEALLFINIEVFDAHYEKNEFNDYNYLVKTIDDHPNPELINNIKITAPSKRLENRIFHSGKYNKVFGGGTLAKDIGLQTIRSKCPRFNAWLTKLEKV